MSSTSSPSKPAKALPAPGAPQSYQDRLRYAIDLLRHSEIEKQDLISKLSAAATPLPQRVRTVRRIVTRPAPGAQNGEVEVEEVVEEELVDDDEQQRQDDEEHKVEAGAEDEEGHRSGRNGKDEEKERREREKDKQRREVEEREVERERLAREQAEARKTASKPSSKASTPRGSLTSPPRKSMPVTPQKEETKTTPRRTQSNSSAPGASTASPVRPPRATASTTAGRAPFTTPPSNRTVSRTKASPSASSGTSSPAAARKSGGVTKAKEATALTDDFASASLTQHRRSTSSSSSSSASSAAVADDSSILQTYIRFVLSPAHLLSYRGSLPATATRFETIEWLRVDDADEDEMQSIHSESLKGREYDDELAVMINIKQLHDADMQCELCIQLWSHSNDVDAVDLSSDAAPEHDLLVQFTATVPELAQCANPDSAGNWQAKDEEEEERFQQIADFFVSVQVMLHEEGDRREKDKRLELEIAIEQERMRLMQEGRSPSPLPPSHSPSPAPSTHRTPVKGRASAGPSSTAASASGTVTPQRRPSLTSLTAPILASGIPSMLDDFHDLIMPDRVFARRQRQKAEEKRRHKKAADGSNTTSPTTLSRNSSNSPSPHHSPASSQSSSPTQPQRSLVPFTPFEPTYYRVRMTVRDLPKMNFHGSCDSYFHVLLSSAAAVPGASLQSLYRSEVQFNQLHPRFASFVLSSVRERDRDRLITLRMINWRQRVEAGHEEVIGEVTLPLSALVPAAAAGGGGAGGRVIEPLTLTLLNPVREFIRMKTATVGVCVLEFEELDASTVSVDTMPSSGLKSVRQLNNSEQRVSKRREKESERVREKEEERR